MAIKLASLVSVVLSLGSLALADPIPATDYDVIVVGGGPSGLSALSGVSRVRRTALLFDDQRYRTPPGEFRALAREQILEYPTASIVNRSVLSITPIGTDKVSAFSVMDADGQNHTARKVVLGTGLRDVLPDTPGLREAWGKGIFWCPWCDGYEHRDQGIGILGHLADVVGSVLEINTQYSDIVALVNGTQTAAGEAETEKRRPEWKKQLEVWNVKLDNRTISSIERLQDGGMVQDKADHRQFDNFRINFTTGDSVERNALLTNFPTVQQSSLPGQLHLNMTKDKIAVSSSSMMTSLDGLYAVGDANSDGSSNVPHAMFSGKKAAVYLHVQLSREDTASKISKRTGLSPSELEEEAHRAIGRNLEPQWDAVMSRR
ncbi:putative thioredoxin reductase [Penicillium oxalicum]|uniref:putative thioredoxin reductase n=1 Tax=Penicillium oxalicum TaxID=69781 RepID=UPI0020B66B4E|nr:putative thioredoxin reductase [Penicillium oxalicum]KAI2790618.1 putative thioredoxin reductase [Penicillium oxalicum]